MERNADSRLPWAMWHMTMSKPAFMHRSVAFMKWSTTTSISFLVISLYRDLSLGNTSMMEGTHASISLRAAHWPAWISSADRLQS